MASPKSSGPPPFYFPPSIPCLTDTIGQRDDGQHCTAGVSPPLEIHRRCASPPGVDVASKGMSAPLLSALVMAKNIERLQDIEYPEGVRKPREDLNKNFKDGKFRYDREFLMQFMPLCKEKPPSLPPLGHLGIEPMGLSAVDTIRGGSGHHKLIKGMTQTAHQSSVGLGAVGRFGSKPGAAPSPLAMGQFSTPDGKLTSEEQYLLSTRARSASAGGGPAAVGIASQGDPDVPLMGKKRVRTKRGDRRRDASKVTQLLEGSSSGPAPSFGAAFESVTPLEMSAICKPDVADGDSPELVDHQVRTLLKDLTAETFDFVSDQIVTLANKSENEKDGRTLIQVIKLVFEQATGDDTSRGEIYARLCRKMMESISPGVQDHRTKNADGRPITGGQLFRKYLLSRCQEDFERGRVSSTFNAQGIKIINKRSADASELYSYRYSGVQKANRRGPGLVKFIGELFKRQVFTERIMHEYVKKLLTDAENPKEEEIENLCLLLKTVGQLLDVPKARVHMDVYFTRMKQLCKKSNISPGMQLELQDVIELRDRKWAVRGTVIGPATTSAVHEAAAKDKMAAELQNHQRQLGVSQIGSRHGGNRKVEPGPDSGTTVVTLPQPKAGDLLQFGKIRKTAPLVMRPSSIFVEDKKHGPSPQADSSSMFPVPGQNTELVVENTAESTQPSNRELSADFYYGGAPKPVKQKKLKLLPRTRPTPAKATCPPASYDEHEVPVQISEATMKRIDEDVKEFFAVRNLEEADVYFTSLAEEHRLHLVDKLVGSALESKEADAVLVGEFFARAVSKGQCSPEVFEAGFTPLMELLDDITIDAPNAFKFMSIMLKGAGLDKDEERLARLASKMMDSDKLLGLISS